MPTSSINPNLYSHIVGTCDGSTVTIFVNGQFVDRQDSVNDLPDTDVPFRLGATDNWSRFDGAIDEVALYD